MTSSEMVPPRLEKWVWTARDFETMGWHDNHIHAFGFEQCDEDDALYDLLLDIDYIVEWVHFPPGARTFHFWICPATLVFHQVVSLEVHHSDLLNFIDEMQIMEDLERDDEQALLVGSERTWQWDVGPFSFRASGFTQYLRRPPIFSSDQRLSEEARGPLSLARTVPATSP